MKREYLKNIKSENRIDRIRLIMPNDPVIGGQPSDNADDFTSNTPLLDIASTMKFAIDSINEAQKTANKAQAEAEKRMLPFNGYLRDEHINNANKEGFYAVSSSNFVSKENGYPDDLNKTAVIRVYRWGTNVLLQQVVTEESTYSRHYNLLAPEKIEWNKTYTDVNTSIVKGFIRESGNLIPVTEDQMTSSLSDRTDQIATPKMVNDVNRAASTAQKTANNADAKAIKAQAEAEKRMLPFNGYLRDEHINNANKEGFYAVSSSAFISKKNGYPGDLNRTAVIRVYRWGTNVLLQQVVTEESTYSRHYNLLAPEKIEWNKTYTDVNTSIVKGFIRESGNLIPVTEDQMTSSLSDRTDQIATPKMVNDVNRAASTAQKTANNADAKAIKAQAEAEKRMLPFNGYLRDEHINNANKEGFYAVSSSNFVSKENGYPDDLNKTAVIRVYRWGTSVLMQELVTTDTRYYRSFNLDNPADVTWKKDSVNTVSKAQNGWWKCSDTGILMQWGFVGTRAIQEIVFPIAFNNRLLSISTSNGDEDGRLLGDVVIYNKTKTNAKVNGDAAFAWIAIGY